MIKRDQKTAEAKPEAPNAGRREILFDLHQLPIMFPPSDGRKSPPSPTKISRILADWGRLKTKDLLRKHQINWHSFNKYIRPLLPPIPRAYSSRIDDEKIKRILADCGKFNLKEILQKHKIRLHKFDKIIRPLLGPHRYKKHPIEIDAKKRKHILSDCGRLKLQDLLRKHKIPNTQFRKHIFPLLKMRRYSALQIDERKRRRILKDCSRITIKKILRKHKITYHRFRQQIWPLLGLKRYRTIRVDEEMRKRFLAECGQTTLKILLKKYKITHVLFQKYIKPFLGMKRYKIRADNPERIERLNELKRLYYEGLSLRKIGKIHGISGEMVRVHLRGKVDIKRHMKALLAARKIRKQLQSEKRT
jgi:hypothetical protein